MEVVVAQNYVLGKKLGKGAFGEIFEGKSKIDGTSVAMKFERVNSKCPQLIYEGKVVKLLQGIGVPKIFWTGVCGEFNVMVMELLGPNLEDLLNYCHRKFSLNTVVMVAEQLLDRVEFMHSKGFLHRDIKPENFVIGAEHPERIYVIDFGLARRYRDNRTKQHIPCREGKSLTGTARYTSVNTHLGIEQSRRDDIEGLAYVYVYFLNGALPWQGIRAYSKKEKYHKIMEAKMSTPAELLCRNYPREFATILYSARTLQFEEKPNYKHLHKLIQESNKTSSMYNCDFDWVQISRRVSICAQHPPEITRHSLRERNVYFHPKNYKEKIN